MQETEQELPAEPETDLGGKEPLYQPDRSHPPLPGLHFVATPIGAARDITLRGLDLLATADVLAAEDTRTLRHLMEIHGVKLGDRPLIAYHDHNGAAQRPRLLALLAAGKSIAYASEAGTPLIADPGFQLGRATLEAGFRVFAAPGPSAVLAALTVSGLPTDRFLFAGFPPPAAGARQSFLQELAETKATLVLYESPKRIHKTLGEMQRYFGEDRRAVVCRELTKRFEEVVRGTLAELLAAFADRPIKGEVVLVVDRAPDKPTDAAGMEDALKQALATHSLKDAVAMVAEATGTPRRTVYQVALKLGDAT